VWEEGCKGEVTSPLQSTVITTAIARIAAATARAGNTRQARSGPRMARREMAAHDRIGGTATSRRQKATGKSVVSFCLLPSTLF
jgi:hypothetical protein